MATITEEGMFLKKRAQEIIELAIRTKDDLRLFDEEITGTIHIGAIETHNMRQLTDTLINLRVENPWIYFDFFSGSITEITDNLNKGLLNFGIVVAPIDMQKYDYIKLPQNDIFGLIMRKDSPLAALNHIRLPPMGCPSAA